MEILNQNYCLAEQIMKDRKPEDNKWYDRVYLCLEDTNLKKPTTYLPIKGFKCYRYNSFQNADYVWHNNKIMEQKIEVRHTMIPICKWVPEIFDKYILKWKLKNIYWLGQNSFGRGYNKYGPNIFIIK
jgi:hypothetical protein